MRDIPLDPVANQEITVRLDGDRYSLRFVAASGVMVVDISRDGEVLLKSSPVLAGEPLLPYKYIERGNFLLMTVGDALPDYRRFGVDQSLVYLSVAELAALR